MERRKPSHCGWKCKWIYPLGRTLWRFFKTLNTEVPIDPAILYLGTDPVKPKLLKDTCTPMIMAVLGTIAKTGKQLKCTRTDEWIQKMELYTIQYYSEISKNKTMPYPVPGKKLEVIILSEVRQGMTGVI